MLKVTSRPSAVAAAVVLAAGMASCSSTNSNNTANPPAAAAEDNAMDGAVVGVLTDEGVECPAMRGDDGTLYTLTPRSAVDAFAIGDRVRVTGTVAEISNCQQGVTITVERVEAAQ